VAAVLAIELAYVEITTERCISVREVLERVLREIQWLGLVLAVASLFVRGGDLEKEGKRVAKWQVVN